MKKQISVLALLTGWLLAGSASVGQDSFQQCAAAFLDTRMVVDEYSPKGKCRLPLQATGDLTVMTVDLSPQATRALEAIPFRVAIRDGQTGTLTMYAPTDYVKVPVQEVLKKCRKGDSLVLLTLNNQYALPHNEILVQ